ncbi:MAG: dihydroorotate dehydrogenase [Clostridiaceae bacterium]|jgi:dihydroorotate dehydrogenase (NAD+) catalytic subunit|nr:dihydroorotate dehydrogenase [Clostridiaceae bacterium]
MNNINLEINIAGIKLKNPVIAASGCFGFGREYSRYFDLNRLGGIAVKGLTKLARKGNPPPRIAETPSGILNSVGLQNPGVKTFIEKEIPFLRSYGIAIIANASGNTIEDYEYMVEILSSADVDGIELNLSCPNVKEGCMSFGSTSNGVFEVVSRVKKKAGKPLIVKLTPNVTDITEIARAAETAGADSVSLINTLLGMAIDAKTKRPILGNVTGGLSGPAVKPIALRMVYQVSKAVKIPIIGMGGISNGTDAVEFLLAGASAVMLGTAGFVNPMAWVETIEGLEKYMIENNVKSVTELIGGLIA